MARASSSATLVCMELRSIGRNDDSHGTGKDKASGLCANKISDVRFGLERSFVGSKPRAVEAFCIQSYQKL